MSRDKPRKPPPQPESLPLIELVPPVEIDGEPPKLANYVQVHGGADTMRLSFFYVSPMRWEEIHRQKGEGISRMDELLIVRQPPVARVSLPSSSAMELIVQLMHALVKGAPHLAQLSANMERRMREVNVPPGGDATPGDGELNEDNDLK